MSINTEETPISESILFDAKNLKLSGSALVRFMVSEVKPRTV